jgi:hypothetical protein
MMEKRTSYAMLHHIYRYGGMVVLADGGCNDPDAGDQYFRLVDGTGVEVNG